MGIKFVQVKVKELASTRPFLHKFKASMPWCKSFVHAQVRQVYYPKKEKLFKYYEKIQEKIKDTGFITTAEARTIATTHADAKYGQSGLKRKSWENLWYRTRKNLCLEDGLFGYVF